MSYFRMDLMYCMWLSVYNIIAISLGIQDFEYFVHQVP